VPPHLVAKAAARLGSEPFRDLHARLLRAYFADNRDITREAVLRQLWRESELPEAAFEAARDPAILQQVVDEHNEALRHGTSGVPAVRVAGGEGILMGAHPTATYRAWVRKMLDAAG
jgi:predicted DsbA family dithiol-disulfide isomerase